MHKALTGRATGVGSPAASTRATAHLSLCRGAPSDFPVLFLGVLAKVTAVARLGDLLRLVVPQSQPV